jgi:hypothetical protein
MILKDVCSSIVYVARIFHNAQLIDIRSAAESIFANKFACVGAYLERKIYFCLHFYSQLLNRSLTTLKMNASSRSTQTTGEVESQPPGPNNK